MINLFNIWYYVLKKVLNIVIKLTGYSGDWSLAWFAISFCWLDKGIDLSETVLRLEEDGLLEWEENEEEEEEEEGLHKWFTDADNLRNCVMIIHTSLKISFDTCVTYKPCNCIYYP